MIVNRSMFPLQSGFNTISRMSQRLDELQVQLGTGKKAQTLSQLGSQRSLDLQVRERLSRIESYAQNGKTVSLRLDVLDQAMGRMDTLEADTRGSATTSGYGADNINLTNLPTLSKGRLDELVTLLNSNVAGRYLMGGKSADAPPVASLGAILDGEGGRAGFRTIVNERKLADAGSDGLGRLDLTRAGPAITLAEDGTHPFGFKLSTITTSSAGVSISNPSGAPPSLGITVTGPVTEGQTIDIGLTLPDGTSTSVQLKAVTGAPANPGEFQIGATSDDTATNIQAALNTQLVNVGKTTLAAASTFAAAANFFNGQGEAVQRVSGPPFETATALVNADPATTVFWYRGSDDTTPRAAATAKVDDTTIVQYGVQANESGFVAMMRTLGAMTVESFSPSDPTARSRFDAIASRQSAQLSETHNSDPGSVELVTLELAQARVAIGSADDRHKAYKGQLDSMLDGIEGADINEVAMELLSLKTRLEASYSTTSALSQLSLVNYLR